MSTAQEKIVVPKRLEIFKGPGFGELNGQLTDISRSVALDGKRFPFTFHVRPIDVPDKDEFTLEVLLSGLASVHGDGYSYRFPSYAEKEREWYFRGVVDNYGSESSNAGLYKSIMFGGADPVIIKQCRGRYDTHSRSGYIEPGSWKFE